MADRQIDRDLLRPSVVIPDDERCPHSQKMIARSACSQCQGIEPSESIPFDFGNLRSLKSIRSAT